MSYVTMSGLYVRSLYGLLIYYVHSVWVSSARLTDGYIVSDWAVLLIEALDR